MIFDGGWFKIYFTVWLNQGFGLFYFPNINQLGFVFLVWAIAIHWDDSPDYDYDTDPLMEAPT